MAMDDPTNWNWRPMRESDLATVAAISLTVHGRYAESRSTYAERLALYPAGCFTLEQDTAVVGFIVSHPWHEGRFPALDERLGAIPGAGADYYLHDIALLPQMRGSGAGKAAVTLVIAHARSSGFRQVTLVAVNGAESFWSAQGFDFANDKSSSPYGPGTHIMRKSLTQA